MSVDLSPRAETIMNTDDSDDSSSEADGSLVDGIPRGKVLPIMSVDLYVCIVSSGQELPDLEQLHEEVMINSSDSSLGLGDNPDDSSSGS
jgi:hypothetical protein